MISIVDCGMGNLGSVINMLKHIGAESKVVSTAEELATAEKIILPGVGHWNHGASKLAESGLKQALDKRVLEDKVPVLGICLGMQLLVESSEEGDLPGLGWIPGKVIRFSDETIAEGLRIPHMGWNLVYPQKSSAMIESLPEEPRFYFVHSYHVQCTDLADVLLTCKYGYEFACAVQRENIWGVQFHPEKSHKFGMCLMKNFVEL